MISFLVDAERAALAAGKPNDPALIAVHLLTRLNQQAQIIIWLLAIMAFVLVLEIFAIARH